MFTEISKQKIMQLSLLIIITACFIISSCEKNETSLATIDDNTISLTAFLPRYGDFLDHTHQQDNLLNRYIFLNTLIDEALLLDHANETDFVSDPAIAREKQLIYDQLLLNQYFDHKILTRTDATEYELRRLFTWSKTSLHVRHLFSRDLKSIMLLQDKLFNGNTWSELAKEFFKNPVLKENGGDLGWINMGDMDPAFEAVAYDLKDAEISSPVKTRYGYSIIQVIEREKDLFLTEDDFQLEKDWLKLMATQYKKMPAIRAYTDSVEKELGISYNKQELKELFTAIAGLKETQKIYSRSPLVHFGGGHYWTVQQTYVKLNDLSARQFGFINSWENLGKVISGLAVREKFLQDAEQLELHNDQIFIKNFEQKYHGHLVNAIIDNLYQHTPSLLNQPQKLKTIYMDFRNGLADKSTVIIDSLAVKSFIFKQQKT